MPTSSTLFSSCLESDVCIAAIFLFLALFCVLMFVKNIYISSDSSIRTPRHLVQRVAQISQASESGHPIATL